MATEFEAILTNFKLLELSLALHEKSSFNKVPLSWREIELINTEKNKRLSIEDFKIIYLLTPELFAITRYSGIDSMTIQRNNSFSTDITDKSTEIDIRREYFRYIIYTCINIILFNPLSNDVSCLF